MECKPCNEGFYSWIKPTEEKDICKPCPKSAICDGGKNLSLKSGYWRASVNTDIIIECKPKESCLGLGDRV